MKLPAKSETTELVLKWNPAGAEPLGGDMWQTTTVGIHGETMWLGRKDPTKRILRFPHCWLEHVKARFKGRPFVDSRTVAWMFQGGECFFEIEVPE